MFSKAAKYGAVRIYEVHHCGWRCDVERQKVEMVSCNEDDARNPNGEIQTPTNSV